MGFDILLKVQSDILLPANPEILDGVDDLMQLSYLSEPSVLYNLQFRYDQDMIYVRLFYYLFVEHKHNIRNLEVCWLTFFSCVLVAINPFKPIPLYGDDYIEAYKRKKMDSPHVYAIADTAIREMIRGC